MLLNLLPLPTFILLGTLGKKRGLFILNRQQESTHQNAKNKEAADTTDVPCRVRICRFYGIRLFKGRETGINVSPQTHLKLHYFPSPKSKYRGLENIDTLAIAVCRYALVHPKLPTQQLQTVNQPSSTEANPSIIALVRVHYSSIEPFSFLPEKHFESIPERRTFSLSTCSVDFLLYFNRAQ